MLLRAILCGGVKMFPAGSVAEGMEMVIYFGSAPFSLLHVWELL